MMVCFFHSVHVSQIANVHRGLFNCFGPLKAHIVKTCMLLCFSFSLYLFLRNQASSENKGIVAGEEEKKGEAMDPQLTEVSQQFERFKAAFVRKDFNTCGDLLSQLKVF